MIFLKHFLQLFKLSKISEKKSERIEGYVLKHIRGTIYIIYMRNPQKENLHKQNKKNQKDSLIHIMIQ